MVEQGGGGGRQDAPGEKAREEFFSEAQELVDGLGRDLLALDEVLKRGGTDSELINDVFRAVHTLKGIAGLFGAARMTGLSHELEDVLDDLRLGRVELSAHVLDLLFQAVELYGRILAAEKGDAPDPSADVEALLVSLGQVSQHRGGGGAGLVAQYDLDPGLLGVLTEYEEHRLRTNIQNGLNLYRIHVKFSLATIDSALDDLKARARPYGEIITYLPTGTGNDIELIELEILMASQHPLAVVEEAISGSNITIDEVRRRGPRQAGRPTPSNTAPPPATGAPVVPSGRGAVRDEIPSAPAEAASTAAYSVPAANATLGGGQLAPMLQNFVTGSTTAGSSVTASSPVASAATGSSVLPGLPPEPGTSVSRTPLPPRHHSSPPQASGAGHAAGGSPPSSPLNGPINSAMAASHGNVNAGRELSLRSVSQTVRVDIRKLDRLMTVVGELAIVRSAIASLTERVRGRPDLRDLANELHRLHRTFDRHLGQMQNGILEVRMVPLGQVFDKLARVVRQISREHDKQVNLVITGAETEIDKLIVEELSDPLMHMIRNAIDHGIEAREERLRLGKPQVGTIALNAFQKGNQVLIEVEDDGKGMDPEQLLATAVKRGVVTHEEARELSTREILGLVFMPGFTTKEVATEVSGRGVGLDVVKTNIAKLGGIVDITSEVTIGTKMTITLPITLAIISVLAIEVAGRNFAMPLASVVEAIPLKENMVRTLEGREVLTVRGQSLPICRLGKLFGIQTYEEAHDPSAKRFVVIASVGNRRLGFVVDKLVGQQDIVIKALGRSLKSVRGFAGATELGDQRVALVLDVAALLEEVLVSDQTRFLTQYDGRA